MASARVYNSWKLWGCQVSSSIYTRFTLSCEHIQTAAFLLISQVIKGRTGTNCVVKDGTVVRQRLVCGGV